MARQKFVIEKITEDCAGSGALKVITVSLTPVDPPLADDESLTMDRVGTSTTVTLTATNPDAATLSPLTPGDEVYITLTPVP